MKSEQDGTSRHRASECSEPKRAAGLLAKRTKKSLASSPAFETFVVDQLSGAGAIVTRKMFGGVGLYCDGVFFGLIARDELYLKVDASTRGAYEAEGAKPFKPYADRPVTMQYYSVPISILESAPELVRWAERAIAVAGRSGASAPTRRSSAFGAKTAGSDRGRRPNSRRRQAP
jgi:DNA transformation protein